MNLVSKKAKRGPTYSEKWHEIHIKKKKKKTFFKMKKETGGVSNRKFLNEPHFFGLQTRKQFYKTVYQTSPNYE